MFRINNGSNQPPLSSDQSTTSKDSYDSNLPVRAAKAKRNAQGCTRYPIVSPRRTSAPLEGQNTTPTQTTASTHSHQHLDEFKKVSRRSQESTIIIQESPWISLRIPISQPNYNIRPPWRKRDARTSTNCEPGPAQDLATISH